MSSRLFDVDHEYGLVRTFHYDESADTFTIETTQQVADLVADNRRQHDQQDGISFRGDWHRVASIPLNVYMELSRLGVTRDAKAFKRWLNDPDHRFFRTKPGRL